MKGKIAAGLILLAIICFMSTSGCAPMMVGAGAAGGYKVGTDERSVGRMWDDATISTVVKTALAEDEMVPARKIDVDTVEGVVTLTGVVDTQSQSNRAGMKPGATAPSIRSPEWATRRTGPARRW